MGRTDPEATKAKLWGGWLLKQHHTPQLLGRQWAMRYLWMCEVKGRLHMSHGTRQKPGTSISVSEIAYVTRLNVNETSGVKHAFEICSPPLRLVVAAADDDEATRWVQHIEDRAAFWREKYANERGYAIAMTTTGAKARESGTTLERVELSGTAETG